MQWKLADVERNYGHERNEKKENDVTVVALCGSTAVTLFMCVGVKRRNQDPESPGIRGTELIVSLDDSRQHTSTSRMLISSDADVVCGQITKDQVSIYFGTAYERSDLIYLLEKPGGFCCSHDCETSMFKSPGESVSKICILEWDGPLYPQGE